MATNRYGQIYHGDYHHINIRFPSTEARLKFQNEFEAYHQGHDHEGDIPTFKCVSSKDLKLSTGSRSPQDLVKAETDENYRITIDGYSWNEIHEYHNPTGWKDSFWYSVPTCCVPPIIVIDHKFVDAGTLQRHELSAIFGDMPDTDFQSLLDSVQTDGFIDPIVRIHEGQILDGWHRYRAAQELNLIRKLRFQEWNEDEKEDGDPKAFVLARNIERRHLSASQRAQIAVAFNERFGHGGDRSESKSPNGDLKTRKGLAEQANVGTSTIDRAVAVEKAGQSEAVIAGEKTVSEVIATVSPNPRGCKKELERILEFNGTLDVSVAEPAFLAKQWNISEEKASELKKEVSLQSDKKEDDLNPLWEQVNTAIPVWKKKREGVGHASKTMFIHATLKFHNLPHDSETNSDVLKKLLHLLTTSRTDILELFVKKQLRGESLWSTEGTTAVENPVEEKSTEVDPEKLPLQDAIEEMKADEIADEKSPSEGVPEETVKELWEQVSGEMETWKQRHTTHVTNLTHVTKAHLIKAYRYCYGDRNREGEATAEELCGVLESLTQEHMPLILGAEQAWRNSQNSEQIKAETSNPEELEGFLKGHWQSHSNWDGLSIDELSEEYNCAPSKIYTVMEKVRECMSPREDEGDASDPDTVDALEKFRNQKHALYARINEATPLVEVKDEFGNVNADKATHQVMLAAHKAYDLSADLLWSDQAIEELSAEKIRKITGKYFLMVQDFDLPLPVWVLGLYESAEAEEENLAEVEPDADETADPAIETPTSQGLDTTAEVLCDALESLNMADDDLYERLKRAAVHYSFDYTRFLYVANLFDIEDTKQAAVYCKGLTVPQIESWKNTLMSMKRDIETGDNWAKGFVADISEINYVTVAWGDGNMEMFRDKGEKRGLSEIPDALLVQLLEIARRGKSS